MKTVKIDDLKPGDILLYHSDSFFSKMIRLFDGSKYNHAAIWDGRFVLEALGKGIGYNTLSDSVKEDEEYVDVYYYKNSAGHQLGAPALPSEPVLDRIEYYHKNSERYAFEQILLLAILAETTALPVVGWIPGLSLILRTIFDAAGKVLTTLTALGHEPMICSELVFRCYKEAAEATKKNYRIRIVGADILEREGLEAVSSPLAALERGLFAETRDLATERDFMQAHQDAQIFMASLRAAMTTPASASKIRESIGTVVSPPNNEPSLENFLPSADSKAIADFVTPGDLSKSPDVNLRGRLKL